MVKTETGYPIEKVGSENTSKPIDGTHSDLWTTYPPVSGTNEPMSQAYQASDDHYWLPPRLIAEISRKPNQT